MSWNLDAESNGYFGFYGPVTVTLPDWEPGDIYTFQLRASGDTIYGPVDSELYRSILWQESENILDISGEPPGSPGLSTRSIGIPEPSTSALLLLAGTLIAAWRRQT